MLQPSASLRIGACQMREVRGDVPAALQQIENYAKAAQADDVALLCFPECFLQGYLTDAESAAHHALDCGSAAFQAILNRLSPLRPTLVIGLIESDQGRLFNTAVVIEQGRLIGKYRKTHLLAREQIFSAGNAYPVFTTHNLRFGINICYDSNFPDAAAAVAHQGARVILCPANNMLPHAIAEKWRLRHNEVRCQRAAEAKLWLLSADVTGERDHCISYGPTAAITPDGQVLKQVPLGQAGFIAVDVIL